MLSSTINRNVIIKGHRTSIRLESDEWTALKEICGREDVTINQLCAHVAENRAEKAFTSGLRVFMLNYFRQRPKGDAQGPSQLGRLIQAKSQKNPRRNAA